MTSPDAPAPPRRSSFSIDLEKPVVAAFGLLIGFGCLLRFWKLGVDGFWYDEMWTVVAASDRPFMEMYREWMLGDPHPPAYFLLYFAWLRLVPDNELWARLPNAIAGTLTVLYLLLGTRSALSRDERIYASALASFSYLYLFYSVNVKQYSAVILLATVATIMYLGVVQEGRLERRRELGMAAAVVGLAYLNHFAMAYACTLLALLAIRFRGTPTVLRPLRRVATVLAVAYLPIAYFLYFALQYSVNVEQSQVATLLADVAPSVFFDDAGTVTAFLGVLGAALVARVVWRRGKLLESASGRNRHLLLVFAAFASGLLALALVQPIFTIRYFILLFPVSLLAVAVLMAQAFPVSRSWLAYIPLIFFARAAVVDFRAIDGMQRQEWAKSVDEVLGWMEPEDAVYVLGSDPGRTMLDYLRPTTWTASST
ncbi:MAG: glycosyltransferase family 39 protein [Gemmatimonadetes bacterium]|nr:glycosyltransferase family 39 protein [Gemmatimonadota bacterium]